MIEGWLVVNRFLNSDKFTELYDWLIIAAREHNIELRLVHNDALLIDLQDGLLKRDRPAFCLFWDKDIRLAEYLEQSGIRLFNRARAIELCDDKAKTHLALAEAKLQQPHTIIAPMTFANIGYTDYAFIDEVISRLGLPLVIKQSVGSFGGQVFLAETRDKIVDILSRNSGSTFLFQKYIASGKNSDLRLQVVGGQIIGAMRRTAQAGEFRANLTLGGDMECWSPNENQVELALAACKILGLDFAGVDLLINEKGESLICEINSNAHFKTLYESTGVDTAAFIMRYIREEISGGRSL